MKMFPHFLALAMVALPPARADEPVIVHEWGTFTCLQDEQGKAIGGINVDDEPVPNFVWQYANRTVAAQYSSTDHNFGLPPYNADGGKGWTVGDPTVTMRLETPVIYLYPPKGQPAASVPPLDVHVDFHGGVLSQYYPFAYTSGVQLNGDIPYQQKDGVTAEMTTGLTWQAVQLGASGKFVPSPDNFEPEATWYHGEVVETDDKVWTTPREVSAPLLQVKFSSHDFVQAEHFIFYRGVGHLESPVKLTYYLRGQTGTPTSLGISPKSFPPNSDVLAWVVEIKSNGTCAFEKTSISDPANHDHLEPAPFQFPIGLHFKLEDYKADALVALKASMHDALVKAGLYDDEATAMLKTWDLSYFKSPGLRFFYIVPRAWVDKVLPLKITGPATDITRVMVGRIELVTDAQNAALARLSVGPCPDLAALKKAADGALEKVSAKERQPYYSGEKPLRDLGIPIPPLVQDYFSLGRFRDPLIVHEQQKHPSAVLAQFIKDNQLASH